jgi:hypothetical protein
MPIWIKRILLGICTLLLALMAIFLLFFNDAIPQGRQPEKADELAHLMLKALNYEAYQKTRYLDWSYRAGSHKYHWDKAMGKVKMSWDVYEANIDLVDPENSSIKEEGIYLRGSEKQELVRTAISYFNNDSFWLVAPFKIFDKGTKRSLVEGESGKPGILVTYTSGGDTPGDTYLWELNEENIPESFRMWVQILPLKGLEASWEGWQETSSGALLPQYHKIGPISLDLGTVSATSD